MAENSTPNEGGEAASEQRDILTGTSKILFPDLNERYAEEAYGKPVDPGTPEQAGEVEADTEAQASPDEKPIPVIDDILDTEAFGNKKVKVKVDGVEAEVTLKELLKGYQLEQHLTRKGQKLSEKERTLKEIEDNLFKVSTQQATPQDDDPLAEVVDPYVKPLKQEIEDLRKTVKELKNATQPLEYQENLKKVNSFLKGQGYEDFMQYVPEIETAILSMSVEEQAMFDTPLAFMGLYKDFKIRDLKKGASQPKVNPDERTKPKISKITVESGSGGNTNTDDTAVKDKSLFDKAVESGRTEDWVALLQYRRK